jgi:predicted fused transcriptional regulator/phosphomethylpyrimidine kinase
MTVNDRIKFGSVNDFLFTKGSILYKKSMHVVKQPLLTLEKKDANIKRICNIIYEG